MRDVVTRMMTPRVDTDDNDEAMARVHRMTLGAGYPDPAAAPHPPRCFNPDLTIKKHAQTPNDLNDWLR